MIFFFETNYTELFDYSKIRISVRIIEVLLYFSSKYLKIHILTFLKQVLSDTFYEMYTLVTVERIYYSTEYLKSKDFCSKVFVQKFISLTYL